MVFHTIQPVPGLPPLRRRHAHRHGPPGVALRTSYQSMLRTAGFVDVEARDDTDEYHATQRRWLDASQRHEAALRTAMGDDAYDERLATRHATLRAITDGLLARFRYSATR